MPVYNEGQWEANFQQGENRWQSPLQVSGKEPVSKKRQRELCHLYFQVFFHFDHLKTTEK